MTQPVRSIQTFFILVFLGCLLPWPWLHHHQPEHEPHAHQVVNEECHSFFNPATDRPDCDHESHIHTGSEDCPICSYLAARDNILFFATSGAVAQAVADLIIVGYPVHRSAQSVYYSLSGRAPPVRS